MKLKQALFLLFSIVHIQISISQQSVARQWNEVLLDAIRTDYARPTVHSRNLFHSSIAMYDAWAIFDDHAVTYFLGQTIHGYSCPFEGIQLPEVTQNAQEEVISYAVFRLLTHRFQNSPGKDKSLVEFEDLFTSLGYDKYFTSTDYSDGSYAALGNYLAEQLITFGLQDGSNEENDYANEYYSPLNKTLIPSVSGNPTIDNVNRWQPLSLETYVDQSGNTLAKSTPDFLSPEWGNVSPFALTENELTTYTRDGHYYLVYHDPGIPPYLSDSSTISEYQWGFSLVNIWSSHLDPHDGIMWDISPKSIGNIQSYPETTTELRDFYNLLDGGDISLGHTSNPTTNLPYDEQMVPRGDYTRVLAEFWADGPDSETPPGHWYTILNSVNDHPLFEKRLNGQNEALTDLEWDVKAYFTLGGAVHDAAISAWSIKGWYDYLRPISAIRCMSDMGQSTNQSLANYSPSGIPLIEGFIEVVSSDDALKGDNNQHIGKIKLKAWKGPDHINEPSSDMAGVAWVLAENWWPYQRPSFVTPPFAGYVSGHSVFSRAAAEVLTALTGDEFFPGGMGEFQVKKNEFLVFEEGPSVDMTLQWATYRDASDQTSLSRIWGGIHPPADDIPGRVIGDKIGINAYKKAITHFNMPVSTGTTNNEISHLIQVYPNPVSDNNNISIQLPKDLTVTSITIIDLVGNDIMELHTGNDKLHFIIPTYELAGTYLIKIHSNKSVYTKKIFITD